VNAAAARFSITMIRPSDAVRPCMWSVSVCRNTTRSSSSPSAPIATIAMTRAGQKPSPAETTKNAVYAPSMTIWPCAKFRMPMIPNTRVMPMATVA
jgi:hypothetical protein